MRVLMITGDKNVLKPGTGAGRRLELQRAQCERLEAIYWGRGSWWPKIPAGKFDIVTVQDPFWRGLFAWLVAKHKGAKFHVQVHTDLGAQSRLRHVLSQVILRHADGIRVVSEKIKAQVQHMGVRVPISVLPIFVDLSRFRAVERKSHNGKNILWAGRFEEEKDPFAAISIIEQIKKEIGDARLIMLGKGSLESHLREQAKGLLIEFPGWVDPVEFLSTADAVLCTSKHESWGASMVEALAAGVPVVAPDVGVAREAGVIIADTKEDLAQKVIDVLKSGQRGELKLHLPSAEEWARQWYADISTCCY